MPRLAREVRCPGRRRRSGSARSGSVIRAPIETIWALLCSPGELGGLLAPGQCGPDAVHLVGRDLLAVARPAEHDAEVAGLARDGLGAAQAGHRVVVLGVVVVRAVVDHVMPLLEQVLDEVDLQVVRRVVAADVHAHARILPPPVSRRRPKARSVEDRALGAGALDLVEAGVRGDQDHAVPQLGRGLALGRRRDDRAEEGHVVDRDDRRADVLADLGDALLVAGPQLRVVLVAGGVRRQLGRQADLGERLRDDLVPVLDPLGVDPGAHRVVQRLDDVVAVQLLGGDDDPDRAPGLGPSSPGTPPAGRARR